MGAAIVAWSVVVLAVTTSTAAGQSAESIDQAAIGRVDPASMIDVESFAERADRWVSARVDHRLAAVARAEALAAEAKAAEEAEQARLEEEARLEAEEEARRQAEERARLEAEEQARREAEAATTTTTTTAPPADEGDGEAGGGDAPTGSPTPEQWHALRDCESNNNYRAVSPTGRYRGAYQFSTSTWDWLASSRYPELVGVDPIDASPADQDRMAYALYELNGASPWPHCGRYLS